MKLSHLDDTGAARMVDISEKTRVKRTARASGTVLLKPDTLILLKEKTLKKGDALACARIAGIMAAKKTSDLIPLCHPIAIDKIDIEFEFFDSGVTVQSTAVCVDKTGIEMEALTAVSAAALTIYDMCKAADKSITITDIHLVEKFKEPI